MDLSFSLSGHNVQFLPQKAIWIAHISSIFVADLHFGKAAHFRKSGIPIPEPIHYHDLNLIQQLLETYNPVDFYILGDAFHSDWNEQWVTLNNFLKQFDTTTFHLVLGNHDILNPKFYHDSVFQVYLEPLVIDNIILTHEPMDKIPSGMINFCGHIHPGIRLIGKGRQSLRIPCFHLLPSQLIFPAFGQFTGLSLVKPKPMDKIFGVCEEKIIEIL